MQNIVSRLPPKGKNNYFKDDVQVVVVDGKMNVVVPIIISKSPAVTQAVYDGLVKLFENTEFGVHYSVVMHTY